MMLRERAEYIDRCGEAGGTAAGFREYIKHRAAADPRIFPVDALRDAAATKAWEAQPRKRGPDLFSINGVVIPEFLTRPKAGFIAGLDDEADDDPYEKVGAAYATVNDLREDANIKMRNAIRVSAAAQERVQQADEAVRRARGALHLRIFDLADGRT
jgi:hypothetical protein